MKEVNETEVEMLERHRETLLCALEHVWYNYQELESALQLIVEAPEKAKDIANAVLRKPHLTKGRRLQS